MVAPTPIPSKINDAVRDEATDQGPPAEEVRDRLKAQCSQRGGIALTCVRRRRWVVDPWSMLPRTTARSFLKTELPQKTHVLTKAPPRSTQIDLRAHGLHKQAHYSIFSSTRALPQLQINPHTS